MLNHEGQNPLRILGVSGSMSKDSRCARLTNLILSSAQNRGAQVRLLDLYEIDLPMFRTRESRSEHAGRDEADAAVDWAQAFVLATPDYHGSMSGAMKNFLDHYWREFAGKLFATSCLSHEKGLTVMDQMRTAIRQCYGWSLPYGLSVSDHDFDESGALENEHSMARVRMMGRDLAIYGSLISQQFANDLEGEEPSTFAAHYRR